MTRRLGPEEILLEQVIDLAHLHGWLVYHQRPARTARGWRTAVQGDEGFLDCVIAKAPSRPIFAELKSNEGKLTPKQAAWCEAMTGVSASDWFLGAVRLWDGRDYVVCVWRPRDWDEIVATLSYDASRSRDVAPGSKIGG